jgi:hypothetical protein
LFVGMIKLKKYFFHISALACILVYYFLLPYCKDYTSFPFKFPTFLAGAFFMYIGVVIRELFERSDFCFQHKKKLGYKKRIRTILA